MRLQAVLLECTHRDKPQDLCLIHMLKYILINFLIFLACPLMSAPSTSNKTATTFSSVHLLSCVPTLCDPMDCSTPGLPVHHQLPEFTQTHVHWVSDAIQPSHPLSSPSPPSFNLSQHQGLFKWVSSSHQVAKVLEFKLQFQFFQWIFRTMTTFKLTGNFSLQPKWISSSPSGEHIFWKKESTTRCLFVRLPFVRFN